MRMVEQFKTTGCVHTNSFGIELVSSDEIMRPFVQVLTILFTLEQRILRHVN